MKGLVTLSVTLDQKENTIIEKVKFLIVDQPSAYNVIIDQPLMKKIKMVTAIYCLIVKFLKPIWI